MRRKLFNLAAAVSLVLCLAMVALWIRSYWVSDLIMHYGPTQRSVLSNSGSMHFIVTDISGLAITSRKTIKHSTRPASLWRTDALAPHDPGVKTNVGLAGFRWFVSNGGVGRTNIRTAKRWALTVPHWFIILVAAALPAICLMRRSQPAPGACKTCGYDLRATPERCPECGAVPVPVK